MRIKLISPGRINAGLMLALLAGLCLMMPGTEANAGSASGTLDIRTMVEPSLSYQILDEPSFLEITKKDVDDDSDDDRDDRHKKKGKKHKVGKKKIKNSTVIATKTNNPNGYILVVNVLMSRVFTSVKIKVKGGGPSIRLYPGDRMELHMPFSGKEADVKRLSYKFNLSSDIEKGKYPWPINVTAYLM